MYVNLFGNSFQLLLQQGDFGRNNVPKNILIDSKVFVDNDIPETADLSPFN